MTNPSGLTPKKRVLFQTPIKQEPVSRGTPILSTLVTSGSIRKPSMHVMMSKGNCASTDCLMEETSLQKMKEIEQNEEKKKEKIINDDEKDEEIKPIQRSFPLLHKKYPSEPNLRSCYFGIADELDSVSGTNGDASASGMDSMSSANSSAAGVVAAGKVGVSLWDLVTIARATQGGNGGEHYSRERLTSLNGTQQSLLTDDERPSMSPITKSTRRMPKYMQVMKRWISSFFNLTLFVAACSI